MSLRLEMLQVARLAPRLLGDGAELVRAFLRGQFGRGGGGLDRDGHEDLYYTIFAIAGLQALHALVGLCWNLTRWASEELRLPPVQGPQAAIGAINAIRDSKSLQSYHLFHAALGDFECRLNHWDTAAVHFRKSLQLTQVRSEQSFLTKRLQDCEQMISGPGKNRA